MPSFSAVGAWNKIGNGFLVGEWAASKLRLWPCVHNFMNTHTLQSLQWILSTVCLPTTSSSYGQEVTLIILLPPPTPPFLFNWILPILKHWSFLVSVLPCTQVALLPETFFFNMYLVISYSFTKRWTCHMIYTCVCSSLAFPEADASANYNILGPLEAHWMNEWDCLIRVCPVFLERACAKSDKLSVCGWGGQAE